MSDERCERCNRPDCKVPPDYSTDMCCPYSFGTCAECAAAIDCERNAVDWRARYLALRDAVREERAVTWSCDCGVCQCGGQAYCRRAIARAAVDRILDQGGSK